DPVEPPSRGHPPTPQVTRWRPWWKSWREQPPLRQRCTVNACHPSLATFGTRSPRSSITGGRYDHAGPIAPSWPAPQPRPGLARSDGLQEAGSPALGSFHRRGPHLGADSEASWLWNRSRPGEKPKPAGRETKTADQEVGRTRNLGVLSAQLTSAGTSGVVGSEIAVVAPWPVVTGEASAVGPPGLT